MAIHSVLRIGDPRLLQVASDVEAFNTDELDRLIDDMLDTMHAENGAGLAAPQIGIGLRVVVFGFKNNERYPDAPCVPETRIINPIIEPLSDEKNSGWEGCLSVPGMRGVVERYNQIKYTGFQPNGEPISVVAEGFHARVVQHECDHLDGVIYTQRLQDSKLFGYCEELDAAASKEK